MQIHSNYGIRNLKNDPELKLDALLWKNRLRQMGFNSMKELFDAGKARSAELENHKRTFRN